MALAALAARSSRAFMHAARRARPTTRLASSNSFELEGTVRRRKRPSTRRVDGVLVGTPSPRRGPRQPRRSAGTITKIGDVQKFDSGFEKIEFVVTTAQDPYPQDIKFELLKEKIELLDAYSVDQRVLVSFNIRGNEWQGRHFVNLQAWRLQSLSSPATASPSSSFGGAFASYSDDAPPIPDEETATTASPEKKDDLPF